MSGMGEDGPVALDMASGSAVRPRTDGGAPLRILVVDNYDSFVFNLVQYLAQLGAECVVRRNDEVDAGRRAATFDGVLLSPGPGHARGGRRLRRHGARARPAGVPVLGVCLGHQAIGGRVRRRGRPGARAAARQDLAGAPRGRRASSPACPPRSPRPATTRSPSSRRRCRPSSRSPARTDGGVVMALRHRELAVEGVQFHPESVLTEGGHRMLANWLVRLRRPRGRAALDRPRAGRRRLTARFERPVPSSARPSPGRGSRGWARRSRSRWWWAAGWSAAVSSAAAGPPRP